jgi:hypothetical protein
MDTLSVHGIGGDHGVLQVGVVDLVQQRGELGDLVGLGKAPG